MSNEQAPTIGYWSGEAYIANGEAAMTDIQHELTVMREKQHSALQELGLAGGELFYQYDGDQKFSGRLVTKDGETISIDASCQAIPRGSRVKEGGFKTLGGHVIYVRVGKGGEDLQLVSPSRAHELWEKYRDAASLIDLSKLRDLNIRARREAEDMVEHVEANKVAAEL